MERSWHKLRVVAPVRLGSVEVEAPVSEALPARR
jgi:hypothetical protein